MPRLTAPARLMPTLRAVASGELRPRDVAEAALARIEECEHVLQAMCSEPDRPLRLVRAAAAARPGPLAGALVGVKDIFHVDGFETRAGSLVPPGVLAGPQADAVTRLLDAGAIVAGKTATTEFAYFEPGPTANPHNPAHTPGGSSSGSAAAVAAGFCQLALGTQTIGSMIRPAAYCGVAAFKPTYGRASLGGVIPFSVSFDTIGWFTQDPEGLAVAGAVLCDGWRRANVDRRPVLGIPRGPYLRLASNEALAAFEEQLSRLSGAGYTIKEVEALADIERINDSHRLLSRAEAAAVHREWHPRYAPLYRPATRTLLEEGAGVSEADIRRCRAERAALRARLTGLMDESGVDLWASPSATGPAPEGLASTGSPLMNLPWTNAGLPTATVPAGAANGLPLGLQLSGRHDADESVCAWAPGVAAALA